MLMLFLKILEEGGEKIYLCRLLFSVSQVHQREGRLEKVGMSLVMLHA